jgi:hypothetical protein
VQRSRKKDLYVSHVARGNACAGRSGSIDTRNVLPARACRSIRESALPAVCTGAPPTAAGNLFIRIHGEIDADGRLPDQKSPEPVGSLLRELARLGRMRGSGPGS